MGRRGPAGERRRRCGATRAGRIIEVADGVVVTGSRPHHVAFKRADTSGGAPAGEDTVRAPMNGKVIAVLVAPGQQVKLGARVAVMEAMKMEHSLTAPRDGIVAEVAAARRAGGRGRDGGAARAWKGRVRAPGSRALLPRHSEG